MEDNVNRKLYTKRFKNLIYIFIFLRVAYISIQVISQNTIIKRCISKHYT